MVAVGDQQEIQFFTLFEVLERPLSQSTQITTRQQREPCLFCA